MTAGKFRSLALSLADAIESAHMNHPDFRVGGKIFATLGPKEEWGMVKLTPEQQKRFIEAEPKVFVAFNGAWGRQGCTKVMLRAAKTGTLREALFLAWRSVAPEALLED